MEINLVGEFISILTPSLFTFFSAVMIICFIAWELPRSLKIMDEEYTKNLYPEHGRVVDFFFLFWGIAAIIYLFYFGKTLDVLAHLKTPELTPLYLVIIATIPIIILLGYFKRFFERMGRHNSVTVFLVQAFLDLMHTLFFISVSVLMVPIIGYFANLIR